MPTKVRLVKAMVFPVVMYECDSWTIQKAERQRINVLNCGVVEASQVVLVVKNPPANAGDVRDMG